MSSASDLFSFFFFFSDLQNGERHTWPWLPLKKYVDLETPVIPAGIEARPRYSALEMENCQPAGYLNLALNWQFSRTSAVATFLPVWAIRSKAGRIRVDVPDRKGPEVAEPEGQPVPAKEMPVTCTEPASGPSSLRSRDSSVGRAVARAARKGRVCEKRILTDFVETGQVGKD